MMDISDYLFGIGNWQFAEYYLWVIIEGIVVPRHNGLKTNGNGLRKGFDNSFYQGKENVEVLFKRYFLLRPSSSISKNFVFRDAPNRFG